MYNLKQSLLALGLSFLLMAPCFSQNSKLALGLDYGSGVIQPANLYPIYTSGLLTAFESQAVPKQLRGRLELTLNPLLLVRLSAGYGSTTEKQKSNSTSSIGAIINELEIKGKTTGIPVESMIFLQTPIDKKEVFSVRLGLALGYYSYKTKITGFIDDAVTGERYDIDVPDIKISGFAQSFMIGASIQLSRKVSTFFEFSKLGFSFLKLKQDLLNENDEKVGEREEDYNAAPGLDDLGMAIGVSLGL